MYLASHPVMVDNSSAETDSEDTFPQEAESYMIYKVTKYIAKYWSPVLIPLGLAGNTLSFLVMIRSNNRKVSTCIYMAAISINDNLMMCIEVHAWFVTAANIHEWHLWECKTSAYFAGFSLQLTTYLVIAMTLDKYIAIKWPHRAATYSTPRRVKIIIFTIVTSVVLYNLPKYFTTAVVAGSCYSSSVKGIFTKIYSWFNIVLNAVIPFTLLIHMNYIIVKTVRNSRKMFKNHSQIATMNKRQRTMKSAENQLTTMLLLVTSLFLILLLPTYIRYIYSAFVSSDTPSEFATSIFFSEISYKLYFTNSGINFFLYCVSGQKFRNDLKEIVCCIRRTNVSSNESCTDVNTISGFS